MKLQQIKIKKTKLLFVGSFFALTSVGFTYCGLTILAIFATCSPPILGGACVNCVNVLMAKKAGTKLKLLS